MTKCKDSQLYVVATPIGNKSDFSLRAIDILKSVDLIACEDSRTSAKLLESYDIKTKLVSYHKFNEKQRTCEFLKILKDGKKIALISDAGTPCISDPGRVLVNELFESGIKITSIPGASAVTTFVSMVPKSKEEFTFYGFLPRVKNQQKLLFEKYISSDLVFYESPLRLIETLENIILFRGESARVAVGRELTKVFEEVKVGRAVDVLEYYKNNVLKGEIVCMLYSEENLDANSCEIFPHIKKLQSLNYSDKDISSILSALFDLNKNKIYKMILALKNK